MNKDNRLDEWEAAINADMMMKQQVLNLIQDIKQSAHNDIYYQKGIIVGNQKTYDLDRVEKYIRPVLNDVGYKADD